MGDDLRSQLSTLEDTLERLDMRLCLSRPDALAITLRTPDSEEHQLMQSVLDAVTNVQASSLGLLRSVCGDLEGFMDARGPLLAAPLDLAPPGELPDEELWGSEHDIDPILLSISPLSHQSNSGNSSPTNMQRKRSLDLQSDKHSSSVTFSSSSTADEPLIDYSMSNSSSGALYQSIAGANSLLDNYLLILVSQTIIVTCCDLLHPLLADLRSATLQGALRLLAHVTKSGLPLMDRLLAFVMVPDIHHSPKSAAISSSSSSSFNSVSTTSRGSSSMLHLSTAAKAVGPSHDRDEGQIWCTLVKKNLTYLTFDGIGRGRGPGAYKARMLIRKCRLLDDFALSLDVALFPWTLPAHSDSIKCVSAAHISAAIVLTASFDRTLRIWELPTRLCLAQFVGHQSVVTWGAFAPRDHKVYSCSLDGTIKIWASSTGACLRTLSGHEDGVVCCDVSADHELLCSASLDGTVRIWQVADGALLRTFRGHKHFVKVARFMPGGEGVVSAGLDRQIIAWDLHQDAQSPLYTVANAHDDHILDLVMAAPDLMLTCSRDLTIKLWSLVTGQLRWTVQYDTVHWACSLSFSSAATLFATASLDNCIGIYRTVSGKLLRQVRLHSDGIVSMRFLSDNVIICGSVSGKVHLIQL